MHTILHFLQRRIRFISECHCCILPEGQVDDSKDVDSHEGDDDDADESCGRLWETTTGDPFHEAGAEEVDVDSYDTEAKDPRDDYDLNELEKN